MGNRETLLGDYFSVIKSKKPEIEKKIKLEDIVKLSIKELEESGKSEIFSVVCDKLIKVLKIDYIPKSFDINTQTQYIDMPLYHCWLIIASIKNRMFGETFDKNVDELVKKTELNVDNIFLERCRRAPDQVKIIMQSIEQIDRYLTSTKPIKNVQNESQMERELDSLEKQKKVISKSDSIIEIAHQEDTTILNEGQKILESAKEQAHNIIEEASRTAEIREIKSIVKSRQFNEAKKLSIVLTESFNEIHQQIRQLNSYFGTIINREVFYDLVNLYDSIDNEKSRQKNLLKENPDPLLKENIQHLNRFSINVLQTLASMGIEPIISEAQTPYDGRIHDVVIGDDNFDPNKAVIKKSLRAGFKMGNQILRVERVEIR